MELTGSKLRLASSVSSDISFKGSFFKKRQIILIVVFVCLLSASGGFLIGFFVKKNKTNSEGSSGKSQNVQQQQQFDYSKAFSLFEEEVSTSELRENLRWAETFAKLTFILKQRKKYILLYGKSFVDLARLSDGFIMAEMKVKKFLPDWFSVSLVIWIFLHVYFVFLSREKTHS